MEWSTTNAEYLNDSNNAVLHPRFLSLDVFSRTVAPSISTLSMTLCLITVKRFVQLIALVTSDSFWDPYGYGGKRYTLNLTQQQCMQLGYEEM